MPTTLFLKRCTLWCSFTCMWVGIFIVGAKRTPFGTFGGVFKNTSATELQTLAATAALKEAGVAPDQVDSMVVGQVISVSNFHFLVKRLPR